MGGPSAAIVCEELITLGARRLIRVGTAGGLLDEPPLGTLILAQAALAADGTSRALGGDDPATPDPALHAALVAGADGGALEATIASSDLFYDPDPSRAERWRAAGAVAVEMEAATLFRVAARRGAAAACVVAVSDRVATGEHIAPEALEAAEAALGRAAAAALGIPAV
jgi:uridine phosphorylase